MKVPFFIAKRYFLSKNNTNVINIISLISALGVAVVAFALIVVLSVFNGMVKIAKNNFNSFDPQLKIVSKTSQDFYIPAIDSMLNNISEIEKKSFTYQLNGLVKYRDKQQTFRLLGVDDNFRYVTGVDTMILKGNFQLWDRKMPMAVIGYNVKYFLNVGIYLMYPLKIYVPKTKGKVSYLNPEKMFNKANIFASSIYGIDPTVDDFVILPLKYLQEFNNTENLCNAVYVKLKKATDINDVKQKISKKIGDKYKVLDRFEQHENIYKILKSERLMIFLILLFILIIASVNIVGSVAMLIIDKKQNLFILHSMGANNKMLKRIFLLQSFFISQLGLILGLILGSILVFLQAKYGFLKLGGAQDAFLIKEYPVDYQFIDAVYIYLSVSIIGLFAGWLPVYYVFKKQLGDNKQWQ